VARAGSTTLEGLTVLRGPVAVGRRALFKQQGRYGSNERFVSVGPDGRRLRSDEDPSGVRHFARCRRDLRRDLRGRLPVPHPPKAAGHGAAPIRVKGA